MLKKFAIILAAGLGMFISTTGIGNLWLVFQHDVCHRLISDRTIGMMECIIITITLISMWLVAFYLHVKEQNEESTDEEVTEG